MDYFFKEGEALRCNLCNNSCLLQKDNIGVCGVNSNRDGEFQTPKDTIEAVMNIDPIEKKPLFHFLPSSKTLTVGTKGCNFKCPYCQNWHISQKFDTKLTLISPSDIIKEALFYKIPSISFSYNEPTIYYPFIKSVIELAKKHKIKTIFVSNGFESSDMIDDLICSIDAINIDLKSFSSDYYKRILKGDLSRVLNNIERLIKSPIWCEVTTLLIEGVNSSDSEISDMASFIYSISPSTPWHLSAFYPSYKMLDHIPTSKTTIKRAQKLAKDIGLYNVYSGNIKELNHTICHVCEEVVITRDGYNIDMRYQDCGNCKNCGAKIDGVFLDLK